MSASEDPFDRIKADTSGPAKAPGPKKADSGEFICPVPADAPPRPDFHSKNGKASASWAYLGAEGEVLGYVMRFDPADRHKEILPLTLWRNEHGLKWLFKAFPAPRPLYGLDRLAARPGAQVLIVEGEKTADAAAALLPDFVVVSWPGGSNAVAKVDWSPLAKRIVTVFPDYDEPGRVAARKVAKLALAAGAVTADVVSLPDGLPVAWDLADEFPEGFSLDAARTAIALAGVKSAMTENSVEIDAVVDELNEKHALILHGGKHFILHETGETRGPGFELLTLSAFSEFYYNRPIKVGDKWRSWADVWRQNRRRRTYNGLCFEPGGGRDGFYNIWKGFSIEPAETCDLKRISIFLDHIRANVAANNEADFNWIMAWFAQMIQCPAEKPGVALVLRGRQGTGKTIIGRIVGSLLDRHYVLIDSERYLTGQFNAHMTTAILLEADESFFAGDRGHAGMLKGIVTAETRMIENKFADPVEMPSYLRLLVTSNENWVVPTGLEERRFAVFDVGDAAMQNHEYFGEMMAEMNDGGRAHLLRYLMDFDLSKADLRKIPMTEGLLSQKLENLDTMDEWWLSALQHGEIESGAGEWPAIIPKDDMRKAYMAHCESWRNRPGRANEVRFGKFMRVALPEFRVVRVTLPDRGRVKAYNLPPLAECRGHFEKRIGQPIDFEAC